MEKRASILDVDRNHPEGAPIQGHPERHHHHHERLSFQEWIDFVQKQKPQSNALGMGMFVILNGGVQNVWGIFNHRLVHDRENEIELFAEISSWFFAAIVGFILSAVFAIRHSKFVTYTISLAMAITCWVILLINPKNYIFSIVSRAIGGLAFGLTYPAIIIHAAEVSINSMRGVHIAMVQFMFIVGQFVGTLYPMQFSAEFDPLHVKKIDPEMIHRIILIGIMSLGFVLGYLYHRESPIYLLKKNKEEKAIKMLLRLRAESQMTEEIHRDIDDYKRMIHESNISSSLNICDMPILLIILLKLATVSAFNMSLNISLLKSTSHELHDGKFDFSSFILIITRFFVSLITLNLMNYKRMIIFKSSTILSAVALFGIFVSYLLQLGDELIIVFGVLLQASSVSLCGITDILQAEAFDLRSKPLAITVISMVEFLFHIGSITMFFFIDDFMTPVLILSAAGGFLMLVATAIAIRTPDTTGLSLIHAQLKLS